MKKSILALLLAALVGLTACSGDTGSASPAESSPPESSSEVVEAAPTPEPTEEPTPTPEPTAEPTPTPAPAQKLTKLTVYGPYGEVCYWHEFTYNADGKRECVISYDANGSETGRVDFVYDENGNSLVSYDTNELTIPSWNSDGSLESPTRNSEIGKVESVWLNRDSSANNSQYYDNGNLHYENFYDDNGKQIRFNLYDSSGNLMDYTLFEYDSEGRMVRKNYYFAATSTSAQIMNSAEYVLVQVVEYEYLDHKDIETKTDVRNDILFERIETEYGDNDKISRRATYRNESEGREDTPKELWFSEYTVETFNHDGQILVEERYATKNGDQKLYTRKEYTYE